MDALGGLEAAGRPAEQQPGAGAGGPYDALSRCLAARPEMVAKLKIAEFLRTRDVERLVNDLADDSERRMAGGLPVDARQWCLLGDLLRERAEDVSDETRDTAVAVLARGARSADADSALHCARYLLEMGHDPGMLRDGTKAVRLMAEMAGASGEEGDDE